MELDPAEMEKRNIHLQKKYAEIEENEVRFEELHCEDAEYLIVAFGSCARIAQKAMEMAREEGIKLVCSVLLPYGRSRRKLLQHAPHR
ncbi:MAG: hypothetical protein ACLUVG_02735 [Phocaeicola vulgatus]